MTTTQHLLKLTARGGLACMAVAAIAGCGSSTMTTPVVPAARTTGTSTMGGMNMGSGSSSGAGMSVDGVKPVPTQTLATGSWQSMKIAARATTAVPFAIYTGTSERLVHPPKHTTFHLMIDLNDVHTGVAIPYAGVWATIRKGDRVVFDERLWPMISEYMGPHYGNNVSLPGPGTYRLSLLISPPVSARHVEYQHMWLHPHRVNTTFTWRSKS